MYKIFFTLLTIISFCSCQKVIQVNLNNAKPKFVIEASLYEGTSDFTVRVTKTTSYFANEAIPTVNNANVTLQNNGITYNLTASGDGYYTLPNFTSSEYNTYQLNVNVEGQTFTSAATMPNHANLDSLSYRYFGGFGPVQREGDQLVLCHLKDSAGIKNYYRVLVYKNDTFQNKVSNYFLFDDQLRDGLEIAPPLFTTLFNKGDKARIQLLSMDQKVYDYISTLEDAIANNDNTGAAPSNPNANFTNGALGYFAVYTFSEKEILIQ